MVDEALTATRTTQTRIRDLPARVVVYLFVAACLFPGSATPGVWRKLTAGLTGLATSTPAGSGLSHARHRLDAVFGPISIGETTYAPRLLASLHTGMILLADSNFGAATLPAQTAATGADLLGLRSRNR